MDQDNIQEQQSPYISERNGQSIQQNMNSSQNNNSLQQQYTFQESDLIELAKKSPKKKLHTTTLDLVEYQACKTRRLVEEGSIQMNSHEQQSIHNKLYEESYIIQEKNNNLQSIQNKTLKEQTSTSKMIDKTYKVIIQKLEKNLTQQIQQIVGEDKQMNFEQLGRLLTVMEVFRVLYYDENCVFQNNDAVQDNQSQFQNKRRYQEMVLHEQTWNILSGNDEEAQNISVQLTWCVLRIILDHAKISLQQRANVIKDYLGKFSEIADEEQTYESILDFLKYYNELKLDQMAYKKIGYLKPNKFEEYVNTKSESLTFQPKIRDINYLLESHHTAQFLQKNPIEGVNSEFYSTLNKDYEHQFYSKTLNGEINRHGMSNMSQGGLQQQSSYQSAQDRVKLLYKKKEVRDQQVEQQKQEKSQEQFKECTFKPDVSINQRVNEWSIVSKYGNQGIFDRLYTLDPVYERQMRQQQKEQEDAQNELQQCSFTPQINRGLPASSIIDNKFDGKEVVKGFEKSIGRLRTGIQQRQTLQEKLSHIPKGENYEQIKQKGMNVPSMLLREKQKKRKSFYEIEVEMGKGKHGRIALYDGDDAYTVTNNFAKCFQITGENKNELYIKVKTQIDLRKAKLQRKMKFNINNSDQQPSYQQIYQNGQNGIENDNNNINHNHIQIDNQQQQYQYQQQQQQQQFDNYQQHQQQQQQFQHHEEQDEEYEEDQDDQYQDQYNGKDSQEVNNDENQQMMYQQQQLQQQNNNHMVEEIQN